VLAHVGREYGYQTDRRGVWFVESTGGRDEPCDELTAEDTLVYTGA
jgi:hypothetical protein